MICGLTVRFLTVFWHPYIRFENFMKSKYLLLSLAAAFTVAGCASTPSQQSHEKAPPKANRVQILMYDTIPRPATDHLDICGSNPPQRPYKIIALLTCEGAVDQEAVMTTAIYYRARQMGADAVMNAGTVTTQKGTGGIYAGNVAQQAVLSGMGFGGSSARSVFRANAIVYTDK
jgi:hypothetical protein